MGKATLSDDMDFDFLTYLQKEEGDNTENSMDETFRAWNKETWGVSMSGDKLASELEGKDPIHGYRLLDISSWDIGATQSHDSYQLL